MRNRCTKALLAVLVAFFFFNSIASAGLVISFRPADLVVNATGGMVNQSVDMLISHDGVGSNLFSVYEIELNPAARVSIAEGPITISDFTFDLGHEVLSSAPWSILGANSVANHSVTFGGTDLLARLNLIIDTSPGVPNSIDLLPTLVNATRGGLFGTDIRSEFTISPASLSISAVPEPSSLSLVALMMLTAHGFRKRYAAKAKS